MSKFFILLAFVGLLLTCGCSGGGGDVPVSPANNAPVANAGVDQNITTGSSVTLDGSASNDADGDLLSYSWSIITVPTGSNATLSDTSVARPTFTADVDGNYVFSLIVNDGFADSSADTITVTAATPNSAPVANAGPDQNVATDSSVTLDGSASSDANSDPLTYQWNITSTPSGSTATLSATNVARPTFTADVDGNYVFSLIVNDGLDDSSADTITVTAATANSAPVANAGPDQNVATGSNVTLNGSASSDADGDPLNYIWAFTSVPNSSTAALSNTSVVQPTFTADLAGDYVLNLIVDDGLAVSVADTVTVTATTTIPTVTSSTGKVWMDRNLGASQVATAYNDSAAYGDLYQWGRGTDGHEKRTSATTTTLSSSDTPGHGSFILPPSSPYDWRSPQNDKLWQGVTGTNNPCPSGFRLPTYTEWEAERATWSTNNQAGAFDSPLKLVSAGYRGNDDGVVRYAGSYGGYWSSSVNGSYAHYLRFVSDHAYAYYYDRAYGYSARCLED
ncbi:MAG: hypothetical protein K0A93_07555 [Desulfuromonadaceae bacterium]|nr:hypothetical protein [Desulfuromonadaceae bacterium]